MSYVVYNKETTKIAKTFKRGWGWKDVEAGTERAAKAALTRFVKVQLAKGEPVDRDDYAIAEIGEFHSNIEKTVTRVNLMSGEEFQEPINTPHFCSPAFESYWSM